MLVWTLIAAALAAFSAGFPALALGLPFVFSYMMARYGLSGGVLAVAMLAAAAVLRPNAALAFALAFVPASAAAAWAVRKRRRFSSSVIFASTMALIGVALAFGLIWVLKGITPVEYIVRSADGMFARMTDDEVAFVYQSARVMDIQTGAVTQEALQITPRAQAISVMISLLREVVNSMLVSAMLIWSLLAGLLCYLIARQGAKKAGLVVQAIPEFSEYALPKGFWLAFAGSYVVALLADSVDLLPSGMLAATVVSVYAFLFTVLALSFADFLYKAREMQRGLRVAIHIVTVLLFGTYLMWAGIFENIVQLRRRSQEKGGEEL